MVHTWHTVGARSAWAALRCAIQFSLAGITVAQNGHRKLAALLGRSAWAAGLLLGAAEGKRSIAVHVGFSISFYERAALAPSSSMAHSATIRGM